MIITGKQTKAYADGWDRIWGKSHENTEETARRRLYDDYVANGGDPDDILAPNPRYIDPGPTAGDRIRPVLGPLPSDESRLLSPTGRLRRSKPNLQGLPEPATD